MLKIPISEQLSRCNRKHFQYPSQCAKLPLCKNGKKCICEVTVVITTCFRDFDAFAKSVGDVDAVMTLQNPRSRLWTISHADLPGVHVQLGRLGSGNIVEGQSFASGYVLYLPLTDACAYLANGTEIKKDAFLILEPGCEFCISTQREHDWCSILVPSARLFGGKHLAAHPSGPEKAKCRVSSRNSEAANQFKAVLHQVTVASACSERFESSPAAAGAAAQLVKAAAVVVGLPPLLRDRQLGRPKASRNEIIRCVRELLAKRHDERIRLEELAAVAQVSERTLRSAFHDFYGIGPVAYLHLRQLKKVHKALKKADPRSARVGDVLVDHGVWEFGRFASRYYRLFGEKPSATLRKATRKA